VFVPTDLHTRQIYVNCCIDLLQSDVTGLTDEQFTLDVQNVIQENHRTKHLKCAVRNAALLDVLSSICSDIWTRKRSNCECIATWGRPSHASPFPRYLTLWPWHQIQCWVVTCYK